MHGYKRYSMGNLILSTDLTAVQLQVLQKIHQPFQGSGIVSGGIYELLHVVYLLGPGVLVLVSVVLQKTGAVNEKGENS